MIVVRHDGYPYLGNTALKREMRRKLYDLVERHIPRSNRGHIVTLAGDDAPEVPFLRDRLGALPSRTWFVDYNMRCVLAAVRQWPTVNTFYGQLTAFFERHPVPLRFVHLDFMGSYSARAVLSVRLAGPLLVPGALVGLTFLRCRDHRWSQRVFELGRGARDSMEQRWLGTKRALDEDLGVTTELLGGFEYFQGHSPMAHMLVRAP